VLEGAATDAAGAGAAQAANATTVIAIASASANTFFISLFSFPLFFIKPYGLNFIPL
jgi:hypothetical protein